MEKSAGKLRKIPAISKRNRNISKRSRKISKRNRKISTGNGKKTEGYGSIIPAAAMGSRKGEGSGAAN